MTHLFLEMRPTAADIPATAEQVARFGAQSGLDPQGCFQVQVMVAEALNNIVCHGLAASTTGAIQVHCEICTDGLAITIRDKSRSIDSVPNASFPAAQAEHGRGWPIIIEWADRVEYRVLADHNELTLTKHMC